MKNQIVAKLMGNKFLAKILGTTGKFYIENKSLILTTGTIGFSWAAMGLALKNADIISIKIKEAKLALSNCTSNEERKSIYSLFLKEITPHVAPVIIFEIAATACAIAEKKHTDKLESRLAEAAGALSIAQAAIAQYESFQKETEKALGEEKYVELQETIAKDKVYDGRRFDKLPMAGAPGEQLFIDKYTGKAYWSTYDRIENAVKEASRMIGPNGGNDVVTVDDIHGLIANKDLTDQTSLLAERMGWTSRNDGRDGISVHYADSHYIFPNGTRVQACEVYFYPEPACIDFEK